MFMLRNASAWQIRPHLMTPHEGPGCQGLMCACDWPPVTDCKGFLARIDHTTPNKEMTLVRVGDGLRRCITQPPLTLTLPPPHNQPICKSLVVFTGSGWFWHFTPPPRRLPLNQQGWQFGGFFYTRQFERFLLESLADFLYTWQICS